MLIYNTIGFSSHTLSKNQTLYGQIYQSRKKLLSVHFCEKKLQQNLEPPFHKKNIIS